MQQVETVQAAAQLDRAPQLQGFPVVHSARLALNGSRSSALLGPLSVGAALFHESQIHEPSLAFLAQNPPQRPGKSSDPRARKHSALQSVSAPPTPPSIPRYCAAATPPLATVLILSRRRYCLGVSRKGIRGLPPRSWLSHFGSLLAKSDTPRHKPPIASVLVAPVADQGLIRLQRCFGLRRGHLIW